MQARVSQFFGGEGRNSTGHTSNWAVIVCASRYWCVIIPARRSCPPPPPVWYLPRSCARRLFELDCCLGAFSPFSLQVQLPTRRKLSVHLPHRPPPGHSGQQHYPDARRRARSPAAPASPLRSGAVPIAETKASTPDCSVASQRAWRATLATRSQPPCTLTRSAISMCTVRQRPSSPLHPMQLSS